MTLPIRKSVSQPVGKHKVVASLPAPMLPDWKVDGKKDIVQ